MSRHHPTNLAAGRLPLRESGTRTRADFTVAQQAAELLATRGLHGVLRLLNARTRIRFTGVYRAAPPWLHTVRLFDRENPTLDTTGERSPLDETYCAITCATAAPFTSRDTQHDARLDTHAARDTVLCYYGVPIRMPSGRAWGSLCHFDLRPRLLPPGELTVLTAVAPAIARWLAEREPVLPA